MHEPEPEYLTIQPGSDLDKAIDEIVSFELGEGPLPSASILTRLNPNVSGHMIAIGARLDCRRRGKTDPNQLTHEEYHGWYGINLRDQP